jgi:putative oxidoreductase
MFVVIGRFTPQAFALLRIVSGLLFFLHGTQKIFGFPPMPAQFSGPLPTIAFVAGILEVVLGLLITLGLLTGIAAFLASGEMAVAYFVGHATKGFWPILNQGELAVLYCFLFLYIAAHGAGIWSIDQGILRKRVPLTASTGARRV